MSSLSNALQLNLLDRSILDAKPIYFNFPTVKIYVIGCGGTGSFLVPNLCRIVNFLKDAEREITISLVDFDEIEEKNLYRQNFCRGELGRNKAQALAIRYKTIFPELDIRAILAGVSQVEIGSYLPTIIIGCVDNATARKNIENLMMQHNSMWSHNLVSNPCWWIDCGNGYSYGQVTIGNHYSTELEDFELEPANCLRLPLPTIQYPGLLTQEFEEDETISCAERALLNGQSLNINSQMAVIAAEMVQQLLDSKLKRMATEIDLLRGSMRSIWITQAEINKMLENKNLW